MSMSFLKSGKEAHSAMEKADAEAETRKANAGSPYAFRFWVKKDTETQITFLDGDLDEDGLLDVVSYYEHNVQLNGRWNNYFPCTSETEPCPICDSGDNAALVTLFTVIDHGKFTDKQGVTRQHERKLFSCKRDTFKRLQKIAKKRGGLAGCTFDVSRTGDKSASVGSDFDFVEKLSHAELCAKYGLKPNGDMADKKAAVPYKYAEVVQYRTAAELRKLGFGDALPPIGSGDIAVQSAAIKGTADETDYKTAL